MLAAFAAAGEPAQDEGSGAPEEPEAGRSEPAKGKLESFLADPTLGGKLHLTYRAAYEAKFFRFHPYHFNFPQDVTAADLQVAEELAAVHGRHSSDQDLEQYFTLRTHDLFLPSDRSRIQGLDTDFSFRYFNDLDGTAPGDVSAGTYDYLGGDVFQLRTLNARLQLLEKHLEVAGGRMYVRSAEWVRMDGAEATGRGLAFLGKPFEVAAFSGARVSYYETVPRSTLWGGAFRIWPWQDARIELASLYFFENTFQVTVEQGLGEAVKAGAVYRQIDEDPQSVQLTLDAQLAERRLTLWLEYFGKFGLHAKDYFFDYTTPVNASARERAAFRYFNIGDLDPFDEGTMEVRYATTDHLGLFAGGTLHYLREGEEDQFNTDWQEVWGGLDTSHFPWEGLTGRGTVRYLHTDLPRRRPAFSDPRLVEDVVGDGEPSFVGLELLLEQDFARRAAVGTTLEFRRYSYDSRFAELADLIGWGATAYARYRQNRFLTYSLVYAYDRDFPFVNPDFREVHGVRAEVMFAF